MPQLQNIVLTDRATTPVNHTFVPRDIDRNGVATVVESTGVPVGENQLSISLTRTPAGKFRIMEKLTLPVVQIQTINGVSTPIVVRTAHVEVKFTFDSTSTEQERKDAVGMLASGFDPAKPLTNDTIVKLQNPY